MPVAKRTKIVATIGPSSASPDIFRRLVEAGVDVARLNFSHGTHEQHAELFKTVRGVERRVGRPVAALQDLQGPKIRVGDLPKEGVMLEAGKKAVFTVARPAAGEIPVTLKTLAKDVKVGARLLLDDGLLEVVVRRVDGPRVVTEVVHGGKLTSHKGLNLPGTSLRIPALSSKDRADAVFGAALGVDFVALSFVRSADDVKQLRRLLDAKSPSRRIPIVAKIEKPEGVENFGEILPTVDAVMVARGDLGIEIPAERVPVVQKQIVSACRERGIPVIVATQMLDSMQRNPRATRAEISDVANAVMDHADAVMLSGETATGAYPVQAVQVMADTVRAMEASVFDDLNPFRFALPPGERQPIGAAVRMLSDALGKVPVGVDGRDPAFVGGIAAMRPEGAMAISVPNAYLARRYALVWGAHPVIAEDPEAALRKAKMWKKGQEAVTVERESDGIEIEVRKGK
jgi:pyruvate kinase